MADRVCPKLPIMWGIETLTTLTSMTARKVPDITANVTSHFFPADAGVSWLLGTGADAVERIALPPSSVHVTCTTGMTDMPGLSGESHMPPDVVGDRWPQRVRAAHALIFRRYTRHGRKTSHKITSTIST